MLAFTKRPRSKQHSYFFFALSLKAQHKSSSFKHIKLRPSALFSLLMNSLSSGWQQKTRRRFACSVCKTKTMCTRVVALSFSALAASKIKRVYLSINSLTETNKKGMETFVLYLENNCNLLAGIPYDDTQTRTINFVDALAFASVANACGGTETATERHQGYESKHKETSHLLIRPGQQQRCATVNIVSLNCIAGNKKNALKKLDLLYLTISRYWFGSQKFKLICFGIC